MNGLHGIIFSYEQEPGLRELAERRMPASIPFGGRYRVVDFMLSNLAGLVRADHAARPPLAGDLHSQQAAAAHARGRVLRAG